MKEKLYIVVFEQEKVGETTFYDVNGNPHDRCIVSCIMDGKASRSVRERVQKRLTDSSKIKIIQISGS